MEFFPGRLDVQPLITTKREEVLAIARRYRLRHVRVFGSAARGEFTPRSDVDLLAEFPEDFTLLQKSAAERELAEALGRKGGSGQRQRFASADSREDS
jgi:predicted nucleotidyltransferase